MSPVPCWPVDDTHRVTHWAWLGAVWSNSLRNLEGCLTFTQGRRLLRWQQHFVVPRLVIPAKSWTSELREELGDLARSGSSLGVKDSGVHPPGVSSENATDI